MVNGVRGASLPPAKNRSHIPPWIQATAFNRACRAVEQVMEWENSGPLLPRSWATQEDMFPKVVVGEARVETFPPSKNSLWCFSKREVAPREEPILTPKPDPSPQRAVAMALRPAYRAKSTESSKYRYLGSKRSSPILSLRTANKGEAHTLCSPMGISERKCPFPR